MSVTRILRLAREWRRNRHENRVGAERHLTEGNWTEAEKYLTLTLAERRRPNQHRFDLLLALMEAQRKQGKFAEAQRTLAEATALADPAKNHVLHLRALDARADFELDLKEYTAAEQTLLQIEALEAQSKKPDYKRLALASRKLATALLNCDRSDDAMKAFARASVLSEKAFGPDHVETGDALAELGTRYRELGNHAEAQRCLRRALQIHRDTFGPDSHQSTHDLFHLASSLAESGNIDAAASEYEKVLTVRERLIGADRQQTAETQARLAAIYLAGGRTSAARELLIHAIGVLDRKKSDERLEFALETMAQVEDKLNRPSEAERFRERAADALALRTGEPAEPVAVAKPFPKYY